MTETPNVEVISLVEEQLNLQKRTHITSTIKLRVETLEEEVSLDGELFSDRISIERTPMGTFVEVAPGIRQEGDVTIFPVVEEVLVKRLMLREEVRVTRIRQSEPFTETASIRRQQAIVERSPVPPPTTPTADTKDNPDDR